MDIFLYISVGLIAYVLLIILFRKIGIWNKKTCEKCSNCCPDCGTALERIRRKNIDYIKNYLSFQVFDFKRYRCINCAWEGLRWERAFAIKK